MLYLLEPTLVLRWEDRPADGRELNAEVDKAAARSVREAEGEAAALLSGDPDASLVEHWAFLEDQSLPPSVLTVHERHGGRAATR